MKICEYCGVTVEDHIIQCEGCGSKEFKNTCINCGTNFSGNKCTNCGVMIGDKPRVCFNCGKKTFAKVCPDCGADLINKRKVEVNPYPPVLQKKTKNMSIIPDILIGLLFLFGFIGLLASL